MVASSLGVGTRRAQGQEAQDLPPHRPCKSRSTREALPPRRKRATSGECQKVHRVARHPVGCRGPPWYSAAVSAAEQRSALCETRPGQRAAPGSRHRAFCRSFRRHLAGHCHPIVQHAHKIYRQRGRERRGCAVSEPWSSSVETPPTRGRSSSCVLRGPSARRSAGVQHPSRSLEPGGRTSCRRNRKGHSLARKRDRRHRGPP